VVFHDGGGKPRNALVTIAWDQTVQDEETGESRPFHAEDDLSSLPCLNLVFISDDDKRQDQYGRQLERETSVPHKEQNRVHGFYWRFEGEEPNPFTQPSDV
jgi:hypothetical protein